MTESKCTDKKAFYAFNFILIGSHSSHLELDDRVWYQKLNF